MKAKKAASRARKTAGRDAPKKATKTATKTATKKVAKKVARKPTGAKARPGRRVGDAVVSDCGTDGQNEGPFVTAALQPGLVARTRGPAVGPAIGIVKVPADLYRDGFAFFRTRADLADAYNAARQRIVALGGVLTSSGGLRAVTEPATPGRSKTSLHYTGRAIDLHVGSGMQAGQTPYLVTRDGGSDDRPLWKVYCDVGDVPSPEAGEPMERQALVWKKGQGTVVVARRARWICLTDLLAEHGWVRIPARADWRQNYLSCEWWHFQNETGLISGQSLFGDELKKVWPSRDVDQSGLALNAVWSHQSFVAPAAPNA